MLDEVWTVIQQQSQLQYNHRQSLFSPKGGANEGHSPTEILRRSKTYLISSASPNPDHKRGRLGSQASDVGSIAFEDFAHSKL